MVSVGDMRVPGGGTYIFTMAPTVAWETVGVSDGHEKKGKEARTPKATCSYNDERFSEKAVTRAGENVAHD